ncbi:MAG: ATP-dependent RecD-like DNA helicase [Verrucomicrobia bacterium]|nr:ATP-dependent RecD-like DNA helicase [Verrucomicrobiota bacterium]MBS0647211.1 ATP-dependent RecD-like DNA helicase [Verrucomicrobiota bacterium]
MEQIFGAIERITFQDENGFTVARLKQPRKNELTTIVGSLPQLTPGESVRLHGTWKRHPSHGLQFEVTQCYFDEPKDLEGIEKYLASGRVRGIGPLFAKRIVARFKEKTLDIIEHQPQLLLEVEGIGEKRLESIQAYWIEHQAVRKIMMFLQKYHVSPSYAQKIYRRYGEETIARLQENPYALAHDIAGIGFKTADAIATAMGFPEASSQRLDAGILFVLQQLATEGHTCIPQQQLITKAHEILNASIADRIEIGIQEQRLIREEELIWLKKYWQHEQSIVRQFQRLLRTSSTLRAVNTTKALAWVEEKLHITLATQQKEAVAAALQEKALIVTGGPGTGKSTITKAILAISEKLTSKILLAAPTGRAAKRMSEITHKEAFTIHALLKFNFQEGRFKHGKDNPLTCDLIIVDEASMIDTPLFNNLLAAIPSHARLILVGDVYQLPSVGPGTVLKDCIESGMLPTVTLTEIYRQAAGSKIITNAHLVNQGSFPDLSFDAKSDFFFCKAEDPSAVLKKVIELVSQRLCKRFNPIEHIQVLAPMKRGPIGIDQLNQHLQQALNPQAQGLDFHGQRFCIGDKVMQLRNNYDKEIYNGDIGRVSAVQPLTQELTVSFDGREVQFTPYELEDLTLAYATSVHKYQGSEAACVVIVVHPSHFMMLQRNLLYTAITRGKRLVVLVGTGKAIAIAVGKDDVEKRYTGLLKFLSQINSSSPQLHLADLPQ